MSVRFLPLLFVLLLQAWLQPAAAQETTSDASPVASPEAPAIQPAAALGVRDAVVLGLVEGITEFLPVSSTGHLIIANHALGLESTAPLHDREGNPLWYKAPSAENPQGEPLTLKLASDTYAVVIQVGAIAAVLLIYSGQLIGIMRGAMGQNAAGLRLLRNIVLAFLPFALVGLAVHSWIEDHLFSVQTVIVALVTGAILMFAAERWRREQTRSNSRLEPSDLTPKQALTVGVMQCLALWPGMSRSMVTMVGGYFAGLPPAKAAEFSFLVGLPTLAGAALLKSMKSGAAMVSVFGWTHILLGTAVAAVSAALAVRFLVRYLSNRGLGVFAVYRVLLAVVLGVWFFL